MIYLVCINLGDFLIYSQNKFSLANYSSIFLAFKKFKERQLDKVKNDIIIEIKFFIRINNFNIY